MLTLGATTAPSLDAETLKRLEACDAKVAGIKDLTAGFEQTKFSPLLRKPLTTSGTIYAAGDAMLWKTDKPSPTQLRIDGKSLQLLDLTKKTLEIFPLQGKLAAMAASPLPRLSVLREKFDLANDPAAEPGRLTVVLTPRDPELAKFVERVRVTLNEAVGVVDTFELTDPDGERTLITFTAPKANAGLTDNDLALTPPPGTTTSRPLDVAP